MQRSVPPAGLADAATIWDSETMSKAKGIHLRRAIAALLALSAADAVAGSDDYRFDTVHTQITVCLDHMGFSQSCGRMHVKSGWFRFDADDWSKAQVDAIIDTGSLDMGDAAWSDKVRGTYLDTKTYPTAHYVGTGATKTGERTAVLHGKLSLLGRSQPVDLDITFNRAGTDGYTLKFVAGFAAHARFKRSAFGSVRSAPDVGDMVDVHVEVEGLRDKDAQAQASAPAKSE
jgi:polyisoprenoid-binding protein YceI